MPGSSRQQNADILAYILSVNQFPAGKAELQRETPTASNRYASSPKNRSPENESSRVQTLITHQFYSRTACCPAQLPTESLPHRGALVSASRGPDHGFHQFRGRDARWPHLDRRPVRRQYLRGSTSLPYWNLPVRQTAASLGANLFVFPHSITFDKDGNFWITTARAATARATRRSKLQSSEARS